MYLDKLYTKLYSDENFDGIRILMNEIKAFSNDLSKDAKSNARKGLKEMFKDPSERFRYKTKSERIAKFTGKKSTPRGNDLKSCSK